MTTFSNASEVKSYLKGKGITEKVKVKFVNFDRGGLFFVSLAEPSTGALITGGDSKGNDILAVTP